MKRIDTPLFSAAPQHLLTLIDYPVGALLCLRYPWSGEPAEPGGPDHPALRFVRRSTPLIYTSPLQTCRLQDGITIPRVIYRP